MHTVETDHLVLTFFRLHLPATVNTYHTYWHENILHKPGIPESSFAVETKHFFHHYNLLFKRNWWLYACHGFTPLGKKKEWIYHS